MREISKENHAVLKRGTTVRVQGILKHILFLPLSLFQSGALIFTIPRQY